MLRPVPLLLFLAMAYGGDAVLSATPWEVRKDVAELLEDLEHQGLEHGLLLERCQQILAAHGDELVQIGGKGELITVNQAVVNAMARSGLTDSFVATFTPIAARRRQALLTSRGDDAALMGLALAYPGTPAAAETWRLLTDRAWDRGRLGDFIDLVGRLSAATATASDRQRLEAAMRLVVVPLVEEPPASLDALDEVWHITQEPGLPVPRGLGDGDERRAPALAVCVGEGELGAAADGTRVLVFDHLVGRQLGRAQPVGNQPALPRSARPVATREGFAAAGISDQRLTMVAVDRNGDLRWRHEAEATGTMALSEVVSVGDLVVVSQITAGEGGNELRVLAFALHTGKPVWNTLVTRLPGAGNFGWGWSGTRAPALCAHAGGLLVLSNSGVLARLSSTGRITRVWGYAGDGDQAARGARQTAGRRGTVVSNGHIAIATPADNQRAAFILQAGSEELIDYRGDGAGGEIVGLTDDVAVLVGARATALDLTTRKARWSVPAHQSGAQGLVGAQRALIAGNDSLMLLDLSSGKTLGSRTIDGGSDLTLAGGLLLVGGPSGLRAYGSANDLQARLEEAARSHPDDYRPLTTLASLLQSRGDGKASFDALVRALVRGAPPEYAERAARYCRVRLDLAIGNQDHFAAALNDLQSLARFDPRVAAESAYWRGRDAEARNDRTTAAAAYREALAVPGRPVEVRDGVQVHLHLLARAGLGRVFPGSWPGLIPAVPAAPLPAAGAWQVTARRGNRTELAGGLVMGYADGVLVANRLSDGSEAWWRQPARPLLGVGLKGGERPAKGVRIEVLPGTSADTAGLRSDDVLVRFNDRDIRDFQGDLVPAVLASAVRSRFAVTVLRGEDELELAGTLGGEMVEPIASAGSTVLAWPVQGQRRQGEGMLVHVLDLATGVERFRQTLPPITMDRAAVAPLLTPDEIVVVPDAGDLVGLYAVRHDQAPPGAEAWRLPGLGQLLNGARSLGQGLMWSASVDRGLGTLVDASHGAVLAMVPCGDDDPPLVDGGDLITRSRDGRIIACELGQGRVRWRSDRPVSRLLSLAGDQLQVLDEHGRLVLMDRTSGEVKRIFAQWPTVNLAVVQPETIYLHVSDATGGQQLCAVTVRGGAVRWELPLPPGIEIRGLSATARGLGVLVADGERQDLMVLDEQDGQLLQLVPTAGPRGANRLLATAAGVIYADGRGLRSITSGLPPRPAALASATAAAGLSLDAAITSATPAPAWQECGQARWALVRQGRALLVLAQTTADSPLTLRFADGRVTLDRDQQMLELGRGPAPRFKDRITGWRMTGGLLLPGEPATQVVRLEPGPEAPPTMLPVLRAESATASDPAGTPRWLTSHWRPLAP